MLLLIDNYDSFTYNLAQYFGELGCELLIKRNDEIALDEIAELAPDHICISPGPCTPREAGISKEVIPRFPAHARESIHGQAQWKRAFLRFADAIRSRPIPFAGRRAKFLPSISRDHGRGRRRRDHGAAPSRVRSAGSAVPPRIRPHARRQKNSRELPFAPGTLNETAGNSNAGRIFSLRETRQRYPCFRRVRR